MAVVIGVGLSLIAPLSIPYADGAGVVGVFAID